MIDHLISEIRKKKCPVCVGLDTTLERMPPDVRAECSGSFADAAAGILEYNREILDEVAGLVPAVKIQSACYELYGPPGMLAFAETVRMAREYGLIVIADAKRSDIGATAACYADAFIGTTALGDMRESAFDADFVTVNAYLGADGIVPFLADCRKYDRGIFVLVKTSNPSGADLQDLQLQDGERVYERMMHFVSQWGEDLCGKEGFSEVGAVVGATHPAQAQQLRSAFPSVFFLLPGVGAQGASAEDVCGCFDSAGRGGIINVSRSVLQAWQKYPDLSYAKAARRSVKTLQDEILEAFGKAGIQYA